MALLTDVARINERARLTSTFDDGRGIKSNRQAEGVKRVGAVEAGVIIVTRIRRDRGNLKATREILKKQRASALDTRHS